MPAMSDPVRVVEKIDGFILDSEADKIANEEKIFRFVEMEHQELAP